MARTWAVPGYGQIDEDGAEAYAIPGYGQIVEDQPAGAPNDLWQPVYAGGGVGKTKIIPSGQE